MHHVHTPQLCSWDSLCLSLKFKLFFVYFGNTWRDQRSTDRLAAKSTWLPAEVFHVQKLGFNPYPANVENMVSS
jgi:hypothetical protein